MSSTSCRRNRQSGLWALMDCNNFYASCERLFRPDLIGRAVVVLSNNDGCIVARSSEAKALGIPMGEPEYRARPLLERHKVAVFSSNYALYGDISNRVMGIAETLVPSVEVYSIDEAFLYLDAVLAPNAESVSRALQERVQQWTGIAVSVGIAPTRTLAKLANHAAKKGNGVFLFPTDTAERDELLSQTPAGEVWGIGKRQEARLATRGISTAKGLRDLDDLWLRKNLTVTGWRTAMELRGIPCIDEETTPTPRHTLVSSRSFGRKVTKKTQLAEALTAYTTRAAERLRRESLLTGGITVHIRTSMHGGNIYSETINISLPEPTANSAVLIKAALRGLDATFKPRFAYMKAGVVLTDLCPCAGRQGSLLALPNSAQEAENKRGEQLMSALDAINVRFGRHTLHYAGEGLDEKASWRMRQKHCSPRTTTAWDELATAHCE